MRNGPHPSQQRRYTTSCPHYVDGSTHDKMLRSSIMFHHLSVRFPSFQSWSELLNSMLWLRDECLQPFQRTPRMCLTWYDTMLLTRWAVCLVLFHRCEWLLISVAWSQRQVHANYIKYLCRILGIDTHRNHFFSKACQTSTKVIKGAQTKAFLSKEIFVALLPAIATVRTKALLSVWLLRWNLGPLRNMTMIYGFKWRNMTIK